ncbi:MAG: RNA-binding S4 domain-containing protein [Gammaproteobacteria bacterium]|nr:RNA-binding S4 domain-containing protein [Gammaproteobacteria bacterium]MDH3363902.1 RNA-binding S4 domain-containing protein [Gammaproteobacteria bacterium]MDH3482351.1 RNA-binding S4 domain-containing protein [Gammaproteobacteria bacterium]
MSNDSLRLDRWLWFTRFYKTRTAAQAAVNGGHVRVNGERARAATSVRVGDEIRLVRQQSAYALKILAIPARRGPAKDAQACYEEPPESAARRERQLAELRRDRMQMPMTKGKPDKHTRRQLRDRKGR